MFKPVVDCRYAGNCTAGMIEEPLNDMRRHAKLCQAGSERAAQIVQGPGCDRAEYVKHSLWLAPMLERIVPARYGEKVGPGMGCNGLQEATDKVFVGEGVCFPAVLGQKARQGVAVMFEPRIELRHQYGFHLRLYRDYRPPRGRKPLKLRSGWLICLLMPDQQPPAD